MSRSTTLPSPRRWLSLLLVLALLFSARGTVAQDEPLLIELPPQTFPVDVSESLTVVGSVEGGGSDPKFEPQFLRAYLRDKAATGAFRGWLNTSFITGVSRDGQVIIGNGRP